MAVDSSFRESVYAIVRQIPKGKLMTYGDIAAICGHPYAARVVGQIAHFGPEELPWQRVVNRIGNMASGYYGGKEIHKQMLEGEGIVVGDDYRVVKFEEYRWHPPLSRP
jgi:methylated-DNA-protein-cysteine methyltransferase-like protein